MRESTSRKSNITEIPTKMQLYGVLAKKPFGHQSNKWTKRFFVIKDGYLLYYAESEKKEFERRIFFNIHPKGCIPLGGCHVEAITEAGHPYSIRITGEEINGHLILATDSEYEQNRWLKCLQESGRITWNNTQITDAVIEQQELHGLQMAQEKQDYYDQLQNESSALHDERLKTEELEKIREELEKEKSKMEQYAAELHSQYLHAKGDMDQMTQMMHAIEDDKVHLGHLTAELQQNLESLEEEKKRTISKLEMQHEEAKKLTEEKREMSELTSTLQNTLMQIEEKTKKLLDEKHEAEDRMHANEAKAKSLEVEKKVISEHATELEESIKDLAAQKAVTEAELKEEIVARLEAERRLKEAEESLKRLEKDVMQDPTTDSRNSEEIREEMIGDVKTLKKFFENLAFEAKLDADKPVMIKNSIHARKAMVRRAKTMKYEMTRKRTSRASVDFCATTPNLTDTAMFPFFEKNNKEGDEAKSKELSANNNLSSYRHSTYDMTDFNRSQLMANFEQGF